VLSSTPGNAEPIFRTVSKLIVLLGMGAIIRKNRNLFKASYCSFAYAFFACFRMGISGSACSSEYSVSSRYSVSTGQ
jgi:hypothetical protein